MMQRLLQVVVLSVLTIGAIQSLPADVKFTQRIFSNQVKPEKQHHSSQDQCQYQSCNAGKPDFLNVHMVPHTHDDVGWLKTVDQYYYGAREGIQRAGVQYILDSVIDELYEDPAKRFIYVEIAFFYRWWNQQHDSQRHRVKGLVKQGRLQFILGGWCMNDEASTHYNAIIDQHTEGFRFLEDNFGECGRPRIGWQIDPFGHSREQASLFAQFGFDGLFFGRLDYQDKDRRLKEKTMEMMWMGSDNLGDAGFLFTGVNFNGYGPPGGFCFDIMCTDDPIMDDPRLDDYNVDDRVSAFLKEVKDQARNYSTNHIMLTMGSDFQFSNAHINYKNMDKLITYVNQQQANGSKVNVFYSTPQCYLHALNQANQTYSLKQDDFFPYAHRAHSFWTGYFTSRAALKGYVRNTNNFLQAVKQLDALSQLEASEGSAIKLDMLKRAMGVVQHHDAVSGTEKQAVADNYAERLAKGRAACEEVMNSAYKKLLSKGSTPFPTQTFCTMTNISMCSFSEANNQMTVLVYNPIGRSLKTWVRMPVSGSAYSVMDSQNHSIPSQLVPVSNITMHIPERNGSKATADLVFQASLPALGFATYFIKATSDDFTQKSFVKKHVKGSGFTIKNEYLSLTFDGNGLLSGMSNLEKSITTSVRQTLSFYESMPGNNSKEEFQASGAYIFRPAQQVPIPTATIVNVTQIQGKQVQEVWQQMSNFTSQVIRLYDGERHAEVEWTVGPIPIGDKKGREVVSVYTTDLASDKKFYTDANGREVLERVRDHRDTWDLNQTEPVAGNYYPINSRIYLKDEAKKVQFTVLTDRSQGGGSINDGQIEIMVHRRTLYDDSLGVGEPLNETGADGHGLIVRGKHYLMLDTIADSGKMHRDLAEKLFMAPVVSMADNTMSSADYNKNFETQWSGLYQQELAGNVHLLTLESWRGTSLLVRLEHFYEKGEDDVLSKPATVSLKGLFETFDIDSVEELILGGNEKLSEAKRLTWNVQGKGKTNGDMSSFVEPVNPATLTVKLQPMQIRTFQLNLKNSTAH